MTQAEKLEALVQKAIEGGWSEGDWFFNKRGELCNFAMEAGYIGLPENAEFGILFSKDFACALFGQETILLPKTTYSLAGVRDEKDVWMVAMDYHLQQAVVSSSPIDYMYKAVFGDDQHS